MKDITLILTIIALLACTNHKAQNTNSKPQDTIITSSDSSDNSQFSILNSQFSKSLLLGKFNPATDTNFVLIPEQMASNKSMYCHRETFHALCVLPFAVPYLFLSVEIAGGRYDGEGDAIAEG